MKRNEVLRYPLADIGPESPVMTVRLHRTPSGYWRFDVRYNHQIDIADRLFNSLAEHAGLEEKVPGKDAVTHVCMAVPLSFAADSTFRTGNRS